MRPKLADPIDRQSAFLMQKGIYEYARARAGHYAKVLFAEPGFQEAGSNRVGRAIHSGSRWWPNWSRGCCDLMAPIGSARSMR